MVQGRFDVARKQVKLGSGTQSTKGYYYMLDITVLDAQPSRISARLLHTQNDTSFRLIHTMKVVRTLIHTIFSSSYSACFHACGLLNVSVSTKIALHRVLFGVNDVWSIMVK